MKEEFEKITDEPEATKEVAGIVKESVNEPESEAERAESEFALKNTRIEFEKTEPVLESLVNNMKPVLENPEKMYDTLLSDDASARLVTLFLRNIVNKQREKFGKESAQTYFVVGGRHNFPTIDDNVDNFIKEKKDSLKRTLLITEYISSGASIAKLSKILDKYKIDHDVAALSVEPGGGERLKMSGNFYMGEVGTSGLAFHGGGRHSGVQKDRVTQGPFPRKIPTDSPFASQVAQAQIWTARRVMKEMSDRVYERVFGTEKK